MKSAGRYLVTFAAIDLIWQISSLISGPGILPSPAAVLKSLAHEITTAEFWVNAGVSFSRAGAGIIIGFVAAFPLGLWLGVNRAANRWLSPFLFLTYPIPKILFLPALLVIFGLGEAPKIILIALTCGYQILLVTRDSLKNLAPSYLFSFKAIAEPKKKGRTFHLAWHVLAPAAFPAAISALRLATGTAVAVLFMAESFATELGLGFLIMEAWGNLDLPRMFSFILAMSLMGLLLYSLIDAFERRFCRWTFYR